MPTMNRAQRRAAKKAEPRRQPEWRKQTFEQREAALYRNGITADDLEREYKRGWDECYKHAFKYLNAMFYSAIAIVEQKDYQLPRSEILWLLDEVQQTITREICVEDVIERCKQETGIDIMAEDYTN